ncbi:MAG TPA: cytochrome c oxidase assembly protein [Pantanalinema sp.]
MRIRTLLLACVALGALCPSAGAGVREVNVHFRGTVEAGIPLDFGPARPALRVRLGEARGIPYRLTNFTKEPLRLRATLKVEPAEAAKAFKVLGGFARAEVVLKPGESKLVPLDFVISPGLPSSAPELTVAFALEKAEGTK